jgi:hypothetical protein
MEVRERLEKTVHSFEIINENIIIKRIDKSLLTYGEIRIPNYLRDFFHFHEMEKHDRWDIEITYHHSLYYGVLYLDDYKRLRGKLRWGKELTRELRNTASKYIYESYGYDIREENAPLLRLEKVDRLTFRADVIFPEEVEKDAKEYMLHEDKFIYGVKARYELDPDVRLKVLKIHGVSCGICGFNFEHIYGDVAKGYIQIHQIGSEGKSLEELDLEKDFIPVCDNCHGILHRSKEVDLSVKELQQIIKIQSELHKLDK